MKYKIILSLSIISLLFTSFLSCTEETNEVVVVSVSDEQAEQYADEIHEEISPGTAEGFEVRLWASENLVSDPVALHVDHLGRVLVTITERRRNAELDIRGHSDWMTESITLETIDDPDDRYDERFSNDHLPDLTAVVLP